MVTVIIPAYNYARFLPEAIDSALAQAGPGLEVEVLVVDDGSTDETPELAARYGDRIRYLRKENAGLSAARNTGMREAAHELVVFLDADDLLAPGAVAALLEARERLDPRPAVLGALHVNFFETSELDPAPPLVTAPVATLSASDFAIKNRFCPTALAERSVLLGIGGFDTGLPASEDRDMWLRCAVHHRVCRLESAVCYKRDHPTNMSKAARRQTDSIARVLEKAFSDPDLQISSADRRLALAVCDYQSALMHADAGEFRTAAARVLRSLARWPAPLREPVARPGWRRAQTLVGLMAKWVSAPFRREPG